MLSLFEDDKKDLRFFFLNFVQTANILQYVKSFHFPSKSNLPPQILVLKYTMRWVEKNMQFMSDVSFLIDIKLVDNLGTSTLLRVVEELIWISPSQQML